MVFVICHCVPGHQHLVWLWRGGQHTRAGRREFFSDY